jgi:hypothetical protein
MALDQSRHQSVKRTTAGGNELENILTISVALERPFDRLDLSLDTADTAQLLLQVFRGMRQAISSQIVSGTITRLQQIGILAVAKVDGAGRTRTDA